LTTSILLSAALKIKKTALKAARRIGYASPAKCRFENQKAAKSKKQAF